MGLSLEIDVSTEAERGEWDCNKKPKQSSVFGTP